MNKHYNIIIANTLMNNANCGCLALSISTMLLLDKILKEANISYTFYLSDSGWYDTKLHEYKYKDITLKYYACDYYNGISWKESIYKRFQQILFKTNHKKIFKQVDFIFTLGHGDSFADIYGIPRFYAINHINSIAEKFQKPICFLPQTFGPFKDKKVIEAANHSIAEASLCMARDRLSLDYIIKNVPTQKNAKEYIDMAFFLPYDKYNHSPLYIHVGLNVSGLLWNDGYTGNNEFQLKAKYKKLTFGVIDSFLETPNVMVHLIPHVPDRIKTRDDDYSVCYEIWKHYSNNNLVLSPFFTDPIEAKNYIAGLDFFIGARMHSTIAAFSSGVPVVPLAYSRKFGGLFKETLNYPFLIDLRDTTEEDCISSIMNYFKDKNELKRLIDKTNTDLVIKQKKLIVEDLKKYLKIV